MEKRIYLIPVFIFIFLLGCKIFAMEEINLLLSGKGWFQLGRIMHSSDTLDGNYNYNGNWLQSAGAQFTIIADISENLEGAMGLGGFQTHTVHGTADRAFNTSLGFKRYVTEARFSYYPGGKQKAPPLKITAGLFPFNYNRDVQNLGMYLLRGPVYPGFLFSEFESKQIDTTVSNTLGIHLHSTLWGGFKQDLLIKSETELPPIFDFSVAYTASYNIAGVVEIGAGINFYHWLPIKKDLTELTNRTFVQKYRNSNKITHPYDRLYLYIDPASIDTTVYDTSGGKPPAPYTACAGNKASCARSIGGYIVTRGDTSFLSHKGTKLMGRLVFDPKPLIGSGLFGSNDLKLYGETAVIGIKSYPGVYDKVFERSPVMIGFNIPTFGLLDICALEVEWYGARFRNDYHDLINETSPIPKGNGDYGRKADSAGRLEYSPGIPFSDVDVTNTTKDNFKWSFYLSKIIQNHAQISFQIANDHLHPAQYMKKDDVERYETAFTDPRDYYLMFKIGYFF